MRGAAPKGRTLEELIEENRRLKERLDEAEQTLQALRSGEVDAVVVAGPGGDQVYTLKGADAVYRTLVQEMAEGALTLRPDGLILFANEQFATLLEVPLEKVIGSRIEEWVLAQDEPTFAALLAEGLLAGARGEVRLRSDSRPQAPAYLSINRLLLDNTECACVIVTDLAEQKLNQEIIAAGNFAAQVMEQAPSAILVVNPSGEILRANRAALRLAGKPVLLRQFDDVFQIASPSAVSTYAGIMSAAIYGQADQLEAVASLEGGRTLEISLSAAPLHAPEGDLLGSIVTMSDVSERKRLENSLREGEARERRRAAEVHAMMEAVPAAILFATDPDGREIVGNRPAYDLLRLPAGANASLSAPEAERPRHFRVFADGRELAPEELPVQRSARLGESIPNAEYDVVFDDGTRVTILGNAVPLLDDSGKPRGSVAAFMDITDRKRLEQHLRDAQKMESIGVLAGGIAHDFNNLLTAITGNASLMLETMPAWDRNRENLDSLIEGANRAADLTRQLLAYAGKGRFVVTQVDLSAVVLKMTSLIRPSIPATAELRWELRPSLPLVQADAGQMQQIVMNLVLNAAEAIGERPGQIVVRTGVCTADESFLRQTLLEIPPGDYVTLDVIDTGPGMDGATRERIFEPFFTTKFQGRGLGLSAVYGIVRSHGGGILVHSHPGEGTRFLVLFPVASQAATGREQPAVRPAAPEDLRGDGTVLVVDDEPAVRQVARSTLEHYGYTVVLAENCAHALRILDSKADKIALVILDLTMPGMTGEEALESIRRERPGVPVLLSSGYDEAEVLRRFSSLAPDGFIGKPYSASDLAAKVKAVQK